LEECTKTGIGDIFTFDTYYGDTSCVFWSIYHEVIVIEYFSRLSPSLPSISQLTEAYKGLLDIKHLKFMNWGHFQVLAKKSI
jgi:hypothetical protein